LLHLHLLDANRDRAIFRADAGGEVVSIEGDVTVSGEGFYDTLDTCRYVQMLQRLTIVLCNLITRRLVLIEVVFPVEAAPVLDFAVQRQRCTQSGQKRFLLEVWLGSRECGVKQRYMRVRRSIGRRCGGREETPKQRDHLSSSSWPHL
jgi:hypothetical protein